MSASPSAAMTTTTQTSTSTSTEATTIQLQQTPSSTTTTTTTTTMADASTAEMNNTDTDTAARRYDLNKLSAGDALRLLSESLEMLVALTGDVPPTPPPRMPTDPQMSGLQAEKEDLARSRRSSPTRSSTEGPRDSARRLQAYSAAMSAQLAAVQQLEKQQQQQHEAIDGVRLRHPAEAAVAAMVIVDAEPRPLNAQHGAITRKFYSKLEPPISITAYLARLHQFCPMSTAVYLATSLYIHRLAVEQHALPVTRRNAHRLVLAGLRVATKALEDLAYPHAKVARVGGVSEAELARLEISFCFLAGFELVVGHESLHRHWVALSECGYDGGRVGRTGMPTPGEE
jgi:hypothetical protein